MKKIFYFLIVGFLFTNCTHRIIRQGYHTQKSEYANCDILIKRYYVLDSSIVSRIGAIRLGDGVFSVACSEKRAIEILKNEGCAIGADLINITNEIRPNGWSICYGCTAEFYKFKYPDIMVLSDESYTSSEVKERDSQDRKRTTGIILVSAAVVTLVIVLIAIF